MVQPVLDIKSLVDAVHERAGLFGSAVMGGVFNDANHNPVHYEVSEIGTRIETRYLGLDVIPRVGQAVTVHSSPGPEIMTDEITARFPALMSERRTGIAEIVRSVSLPDSTNPPATPGKVPVILTIDTYLLRQKEGTPEPIEYLGASVFQYPV